MKIKNKIFMLNKLCVDLRSPKRHYKISDDLHSQKLGQYYFIFDEELVASGKNQRLIKQFDENGIPVNKTYVDVADKEYVYFPISIGQMGLAVFHTYLKTQSEKDYYRFIKFADWFNSPSNYDYTEKLGARWLTDVSLPQYKNPGPWQSAFSQSRAISILLRGYQLTGNEEYAKTAEQGLISFNIPFNEGGVTVFTEFGSFYEEYTASVPTLVLNGMIFALCGLYDFKRVFPENKIASNLFENGINTMENILPQFDLGFWSKYNLCKADWYPQVDPATIGYQRLHINQLDMLYKLTNKSIFAEYLEKFSKQDTFLNALKMYKVKFNALKKIRRL
ncbi:MAG: D-glucuronyl C5-epimerase family protein [Melioribacteraceae bacterium]|nr:D-glucuronyl C5-epimerase family protein [Melioribacteraceae bacterium]MCF8355566.1 D-glucuronyl C5-epimerase family protein [Melioribacteraceae bacterium]MCF8394241.1 D-glucuronyl C5-epimerase family protein [Melioribacteraceae bacterium]MCF8419962.1 D-glucuronyl C5-epimerase family protein [Melioribacteraceae bacterium]